MGQLFHNLVPGFIIGLPPGMFALLNNVRDIEEKEIELNRRVLRNGERQSSREWRYIYFLYWRPITNKETERLTARKNLDHWASTLLNVTF